MKKTILTLIVGAAALVFGAVPRIAVPGPYSGQMFYQELDDLAARIQERLILAMAAIAFGFTPMARAQTCNDGCFYSNTYQGQDALSHFDSGGNDTAFGSEALLNNPEKHTSR